MVKLFDEPGDHADHFGVEARRIRRRAELDADLLVLLGVAVLAVLVGALALEPDHHGVAGFDDAAFDRFEARVALAQALERLVDHLVVDRARRFGRLDGREVAGIETRHDVERRLEGQRLAFFEDQVLDVRAC